MHVFANFVSPRQFGLREGGLVVGFLEMLFENQLLSNQVVDFVVVAFVVAVGAENWRYYIRVTRSWSAMFRSNFAGGGVSSKYVDFTSTLVDKPQ